MKKSSHLKMPIDAAEVVAISGAQQIGSLWMMPKITTEQHLHTLLFQSQLSIFMEYLHITFYLQTEIECILEY